MSTNNKNILIQAPVSPHSSQAEVISFCKQNAGKYINTYEFRKNGISNPAQRISELIKKGAIFKKYSAPAKDESGREHKNITSYLFQGWEIK